MCLNKPSFTGIITAVHPYLLHVPPPPPQAHVLPLQGVPQQHPAPTGAGNSSQDRRASGGPGPGYVVSAKSSADEPHSSHTHKGEAWPGRRLADSSTRSQSASHSRRPKGIGAPSLTPLHLPKTPGLEPAPLSTHRSLQGWNGENKSSGRRSAYRRCAAPCGY